MRKKKEFKQKPLKYSDCTQRWYLNGKLHREDGPAIELRDDMWSTGSADRYFFEGKEYTSTQFKEEIIDKRRQRKLNSI
jgi:hypothetical protein